MEWNTALWEGVIDNNRLEIGNVSQPSPFWTGEDHEGELVIVMTLANQLKIKRSILADDHHRQKCKSTIDCTTRTRAHAQLIASFSWTPARRAAYSHP
jgi:hypothetical protein